MQIRHTNGKIYKVKDLTTLVRWVGEARARASAWCARTTVSGSKRSPFEVASLRAPRRSSSAGVERAQACREGSTRRGRGSGTAG